MGVKYNPLTGEFDMVGAGGGGATLKSVHYIPETIVLGGDGVIEDLGIQAELEPGKNYLIVAELTGAIGGSGDAGADNIQFGFYSSEDDYALVLPFSDTALFAGDFPATGNLNVRQATTSLVIDTTEAEEAITIKLRAFSVVEAPDWDPVVAGGTGSEYGISRMMVYELSEAPDIFLGTTPA